MSLYTLYFNNKNHMEGCADFRQASQQFSIDDIMTGVKLGQSYLKNLSIQDLLGFFKKVSIVWGERDSEIQQKLGGYGINYLLYWLKVSHLESVIEGSLRSSFTVLDEFVSSQHANYEMMAQPRGVIGHWLSGNVPMLGMLSLIQGILTKNANVLKVSSLNAWILPLLVQSLSQINYKGGSGRLVEGSKIAQSIAAVYFESDSKELQEKLSGAVQVRMAWGGAESVESIMNTARKYGTEDVIFGPKTSFAVVGRECLSSEDQADEVAKRVVADITAFDQQGCNAPHTLFVEQGGAISGKQFSLMLSKILRRVSERLSFNQPKPGDTFEILSHRIEYDMRGEAFYPNDFGWSILFSESDKGLAEPCYYRTLFVRPVDDIMQVACYCSHWTQSVGVALAKDRKRAFATTVMSAGVDRVPDVGNMSLYEIPWDGMFVMDRLVRWCKLDYSYDFAIPLAK